MNYEESYRWLEIQGYDRDTVEGDTIERDLGQLTLDREVLSDWAADVRPEVGMAVRGLADKEHLARLERALANVRGARELVERKIEEQVEPGWVEPRPVGPWLVWGGVAVGILYWLYR